MIKIVPVSSQEEIRLCERFQWRQPGQGGFSTEQPGVLMDERAEERSLDWKSSTAEVSLHRLGTGCCMWMDVGADYFAPVPSVSKACAQSQLIYIYILVDSSRDHSDFELFMALNSNVVKCCLFATCTGSGGTDRCGVDCRSYMNVISLHKELCVVSGWQLEESRW